MGLKPDFVGAGSECLAGGKTGGAVGNRDLLAAVAGEAGVDAAVARADDRVCRAVALLGIDIDMQSRAVLDLIVAVARAGRLYFLDRGFHPIPPQRFFST